jgi:hypothetical protein
MMRENSSSSAGRIIAGLVAKLTSMLRSKPASNSVEHAGREHPALDFRPHLLGNDPSHLGEALVQGFLVDDLHPASFAQT